MLRATHGPIRPYTPGMTTANAQLAETPDLDLLYPLTEFFHSYDPVPLAQEEVGGARMPEPYRSLLVHDGDMTSTLEAFHREAIDLRLLDRRRVGDGLLRKVVLVGRQSGKPLEFGAIRIDLAAFESEARWRILEGRLPLGTILARYRVAYTSRPRLFFRLSSDERIERKLELAAPATLYGRQNVLRDAGGRALAEVVEILPPATRRSSAGWDSRGAAKP